MRGTSWLTGVLPNGQTVQETVDGVVANSANGVVVETSAGFTTTVQPGTAPTPPLPAPEPPATVTVVLGAQTANAVVVDPNGRSVGVANGQPVRSIPGSTVSVNDQGQLVMRIPQSGQSRLSTLVQTPTGSTQPVPIATQVNVRGVGTVATALEVRSPDANGTARGGVALTPAGVVVLPQGDANQLLAPKIGAPPASRRRGSVHRRAAAGVLHSEAGLRAG